MLTVINVRRVRFDGSQPNPIGELHIVDESAIGLAIYKEDTVNVTRLQRHRVHVAKSEIRVSQINSIETEDEIERARRLVIRSFMGFGSNAHSDKGRGHKTTGFRANSNRSGSTPAQDWRNYPDALPALIERMRGVIIERRPAVQVMAVHDSATTLHYVDPPYLPETRNRRNPHDPKHQYRHDMTLADHVDLLEFIRGLAGMVVLSGYPHALYDEQLGDWHRFERDALADGARPRTEVVWINPACSAALKVGTLFQEAV